MFRVWSIIAVLFLVGCGRNLRPDPVPVPAFDANYAAGEGIACGSYFNGLAVCGVKRGAALNSINLRFKGYGKGTIRLDSDRCQVSTSFRYETTGDIPVALAGNVNESCFIDFVLSHEFPGEQSSGIEISPVKGRIWVVVNELPQSFTQINKIKETLEGRMVLSGLKGADAKISMRACGVTYDATLPVVDGKVTLKLSDMNAPRSFNTRCAMTGLVQSGGEAKMIRWMYFVYDKRFTPLPLPVIERDGDKLKVVADSSVSIISLDDKQLVNTEAHFKFDTAQNHVLRMMTVKGRLLMGVWSAKYGEWTWIP